MIPPQWYRDFLGDLKELLQAGFPVIEALESVANARQSGRRARSAELAAWLVERLRGGSTLAEAMASRREIPEVQAAMVDAAERSGSLVSVLGRLVERMDQQRQTLAEFTSQAAYPLVLLTAAVVLLPLTLLVSGNFWNYLLIQVLFFVPVLLIVFLVLKGPRLFGSGSPVGASYEHRVLRLPVIGSVVARFVLGKVFGLLGMLLEAGLSLNEAIPLAARTAGWKRLEADVLAIESEVRSGKTATEALESIEVFAAQPEWIARVAVGEKAGTLDRSFRELGANLDESGRSLVKRYLRALPVIVTLLVGLLLLYAGLKVVRIISGEWI